LRTWYRIDGHDRLCEVLEDKAEIELLQAVLDTLQGCNFDVGKGDYEEWRVSEMDQTFRRWLETGTCAERHTVKR